MRRPPRRSHPTRLGAALAAVAAALLVPALALAHPLGNFTINHFAAIRVAPSLISLDVVIDRAEIPAFQEQQRLDTNADGALATAELAGQAEAGCRALESDLRLVVSGKRVPLTLVATGLSLPPGAGGLPTMRLVCQYESARSDPVSATTLDFADASFAERIGWREIVVLGDSLLVDGSTSIAVPAGGVSGRLTAYPDDLLAQPLDVRSISVAVAPGGAPLPPWTAPDAEPIGRGGQDPGTVDPATPVTAPETGAVPGGITEDLAALVDVEDLTPIAILLSLAVAFGLGVVHALSPGHGKTIMAAYLVGSGGSGRQAIGLGLAVAVSHTLGVLVLAVITLAASSVLPPERLYPILAVVSGALVIGIGGSLLWSRLRELRRMRAAANAHAEAHAHGHVHEHDHDYGHGHSHDHPHVHRHDTGAAVSWRGMLALGLSGGLVPSASALILLLGSIAAGRLAYGLVLVIGFGLGMAVVLTGIGLLLAHARALVERGPSTASLRRLAAPVQLATAALVVVLGVVLTGQALAEVL